MQKQKTILLIILAGVAISVPLIVSAADLTPLVTCGVHTGQGQGTPGMLSPMTNICSICDLLALVQTGFNFVWKYLTIPIATVMLLYGGFLMISSSFTGSSTQITSGKKVLSNTFLGLAIVFFAWIGVDSILKIMGAQQGGKFGPWNQIKCNEEAARIPTFGGSVDVIPVELQCPSGFTEKWVSGSNVCDPSVQRAIVSHAGERGFGFGSSCNGSAVNQYDSAISNSCAGLPANRVRAIILKESGGNRNVPVTGRGEVGIMQINPGTARQYVPELQGQSLSSIASWLTNPDNNIRAGCAYYSSLLQTNKGNHDRATRGYNGGAAANLPSRDCDGITRSECEFDNRDHTIRNTGYQVTRNYDRWVNNCQSTLGG